ncbi:hypothetical protein OBBRIDRAFT_174605 [Obba rivulosa]|uniref:Uncharacterized protein n=1 Tax=Obba rivulosa TaxID=1052685 RepID=A0A8E2AMD6_9APHY|nr:hypothetical protein OBBRIDRAFT_174605 [Obba rivulosa]
MTESVSIAQSMVASSCNWPTYTLICISPLSSLHLFGDLHPPDLPGLLCNQSRPREGHPGSHSEMGRICTTISFLFQNFKDNAAKLAWVDCEDKCSLGRGGSLQVSRSVQIPRDSTGTESLGSARHRPAAIAEVTTLACEEGTVRVGRHA